MNNKINSSYKVIADHLRSMSFLIADGILPANEGRGYVLRRIMRRAMLHSHKLNPQSAFIYKLVPSLICKMGDAFPEIVTAKDLITSTIKDEEERFKKTLDNGMKLLEEELQNNKNKQFCGKTAFKLYDTYGFPLDLTQNILKEKNIEVNLDEFDKEMAEQKQRAKKNWSGSGQSKDSSFYLSLKEKFKETKFVGYDKEEEKAKILAIILDEKEVEEINENSKNAIIILDKTPFYATSGGQVGDSGKLIKDKKNFINISETKKIAGNLFGHFVALTQGNLKVGDEITAQIKTDSRNSRKRNHSVTHLLHYVLKQKLGNQITQKGSNVDASYLTFDFNYNKSIEEKELKDIEDTVNNLITQNSEVKTQVMPLDSARKKGAVALFGEKYDDVVRVISMAKGENDEDLSVEFCGGTHVKKTGDIGLFKIISEKSIAAGIRRITAQTNNYAKKELENKEQEISNNITSLIDSIKQKSKELEKLKGKKEDISNLFFPKVEKINYSSNKNKEILDNWRNKIKILQETFQNLQNELKKKNKEIEKLKKAKLADGNTNFKEEEIGDITLTHNLFEDLNAKDLRDLITQIKSKKEYQENSIILFFSSFEGKVAVCLSISHNLTNNFQAGKLIPQIVEEIGGKGGGGKPDLAFGGGNNKDGVNSAIERLKKNLN